MDNKFCVYEHLRADTNECFYVGKGTKKRAYNMIRNENHNEIVKKYGAYTKIIKDNLSENEAYKLEEETIRDYVFNKNFSIDVLGYNDNRFKNGHLTNRTFGGDGGFTGIPHTEEWKKEHSRKMSGKNNPMFGVNVWELMDEDKRERLREIHRQNSLGEKNNMYGISPKERMDEKTYNNWLAKKRENSKGSKNPNYGNDTLHKKLLENPELKVQYYSRPGGQNGRSQAVGLYDLNYNLIKEFECTTYCAQWLKDNYGITSRITSMITSIKRCALNNTPYKKQFIIQYI